MAKFRSLLPARNGRSKVGLFPGIASRLLALVGGRTSWRTSPLHKNLFPFDFVFLWTLTFHLVRVEWGSDSLHLQISVNKSSKFYWKVSCQMFGFLYSHNGLLFIIRTIQPRSPVLRGSPILFELYLLSVAVRRPIFGIQRKLLAGESRLLCDRWRIDTVCRQS